MSFRQRVAAWIGGKPSAPDPVQKETKPRRVVISDYALAVSASKPQVTGTDLFVLPSHPPGVTPSASMAMDDAIGATSTWAGSAFGGMSFAGVTFLGFPILAELAQRPEYRRISETIATEMTRRWIKLQASGDGDKGDRITAINKAMDRMKVREVFREAAEQDGFFGRSHIYLDFGSTDDPVELATPIGDGRDKVSQAKVKKGSFAAVKSVEPVWCYPSGYNTASPLKGDWYKPAIWYVQGKAVHASRLLTFVGREVPDLFKPAYSFGGLSMSQMAQPYVDNWIRTRQSVSDLLHSFSTTGIKTDLANAMTAEGGTGFLNRLAFFANTRDNKGVMALDLEEEFFNVSAPLGSLDKLQAQAQEHMASVSGIPLVKLLGVTPSGLNASSDGEIRSFYDWIHAYQETLFREPITRLLGFIQLSEFGDVDPDIGFIFEPLWSMSEKEAVDVKLVEAQTDAVMIEAGVLMPEEARERVANDPDTAYPGLDLSLELNPPDLGQMDDLPHIPKPEAGD